METNNVWKYLNNIWVLAGVVLIVFSGLLKILPINILDSPAVSELMGKGIDYLFILGFVCMVLGFLVSRNKLSQSINENTGDAINAVGDVNINPSSTTTSLKKMKWNYFISHAHEDKVLVASPLAYALQLSNFKVWYDEFTLSLGDSLLQSVDNGLANSEFGIVILSPNFLAKKWTQRELAALLGKERGEEKVILPVWHNITINDLIEKSPILADRIGVSTEKGTQYVLEQIIRASYPEKSFGVRRNIFSIPDETTLDLVNQQLRNLIQQENSLEDIRFLITAHQWLLRNFNAREGNLIAAYKVEAENICDFIVVREHGVTGPIDITLIKLDNPVISEGELITYIKLKSDSFKSTLGKKREFDERGYNDYFGKPYIGEFDPMLAIANRICEIVKENQRESGNVHWERPQVWSFRILLVVGRRSTNQVNERESIASEHSIGLGIASYDRFFDENNYWV